MYTGAETEVVVDPLPDPSDHLYSTPDGNPSPGRNEFRYGSVDMTAQIVETSL